MESDDVMRSKSSRRDKANLKNSSESQANQNDIDLSILVVKRRNLMKQQTLTWRQRAAKAKTSS